MSNHDVRIELNDNLITAVAKMSDGNPGALQVCMELITQGEKIDPDAFGGGFGNILSLDTHGIYGTDIYVLNNDICDRNVARTIALLRAVQLGFFSADTLKSACSRQDYSGRDMVDVEGLYKQVKERLPNFDPENLAFPVVELTKDDLKGETIELLTYDGKDELIVSDPEDDMKEEE